MRLVHKAKLTSPLSAHPLQLCEHLRQQFDDQPEFVGYMPRQPRDGPVQPEYAIIESNTDISKALDKEWLAKRGYVIESIHEVG